MEDAITAAGDKLLVIHFWASWCPPCMGIGPVFEALQSEEPSVVFIKVNVDDNAETAEKYNIMAMPTFKFIKGGTDLNDDVMGANKEKLRQKINQYK